MPIYVYKNAFFNIGLAGSCEMGLLLLLSIASYSVTTYRHVRLAFFCLILFAMFELPQFISFALTNSSQNYKLLCSLQLVATIFFLNFFSVTSLLLDDSLSFQQSDHIEASYITLMLKKKRLVAANLICPCFVIGAIVQIAGSGSLEEAFSSIFLYSFQLLLQCFTLGYSIMVLYYAWAASSRIQMMSSRGRERKLVGSENYTRLMLIVLRKIRIIAACYIISSIISTATLTHDFVVFEMNKSNKYSFAWYILAELIPSALPTFAFIAVFGVGSLVCNEYATTVGRALSMELNQVNRAVSLVSFKTSENSLQSGNEHVTAISASIDAARSEVVVNNPLRANIDDGGKTTNGTSASHIRTSKTDAIDRALASENELNYFQLLVSGGDILHRTSGSAQRHSGEQSDHGAFEGSEQRTFTSVDTRAFLVRDSSNLNIPDNVAGDVSGESITYPVTPSASTGGISSDDFGTVTSFV